MYTCTSSICPSIKKETWGIQTGRQTLSREKIRKRAGQKEKNTGRGRNRTVIGGDFSIFWKEKLGSSCVPCAHLFLSIFPPFSVVLLFLFFSYNVSFFQWVWTAKYELISFKTGRIKYPFLWLALYVELATLMLFGLFNIVLLVYLCSLTGHLEHNTVISMVGKLIEIRQVLDNVWLMGSVW